MSSGTGGDRRATQPGWWARIPMWVPVVFMFSAMILAVGETRWRVSLLWDEERESSAQNEKLQWEAIAELNRFTVRSQAKHERYDERTDDAIYERWVAFKAQTEQNDENHESRITRLERDSR